MSKPNPADQVLWQVNQWRCEYSPVTDDRGVFRLLDADVRVIEAECSPEVATRDFAATCRALVETVAERREDM
jgi:hypothetical protein